MKHDIFATDWEYRERVKYDHVVVNDDLGRAVREVREKIGLEAEAKR